MQKVANNIEAAIKSIKKLPIATQQTLRPDMFGVLDKARTLAEKITVTPSGGKLASRIDAAKKRAAADCALHILQTYGSKKPKLTRGGPYFELTALLFEIGTGKVGDVELACKSRRRAKPMSARTFEMFEMVLEDDDAPKIFEDHD